jgi:RHS repeat-associated protein
LPFGETMAEQRQYTYGTPYKFNGKESDEETGLYYYGARYYDPKLSMWYGVDPLVHKMPAWSPYNYTANNPINFIDPDGRFPWPVTVRSFISANRVGLGMFRGDGRGASFTGTSRVYSSFTVDPTAGTLTNRSTNSDPTVFYGTLSMSIPYIPGSTKTPKPEMSADITGRGESTLSMSFSHEAKDPITPGFATPDLDLNATLYFREDLENGILNVIGSFTGDNFPSAEAFITDQLGTNLFLGASMETGGVHSLFGENNNLKFNILIQIMFDSNGNFTGVKQGDNIISVQDWNKQVQDSFNK